MSKNPFATNNKFGLPLEAPSLQTIIPVIENPSGRVYGFFTIDSTTFDGTETTFTLSDGTIDIQSVTLHTKVSLDNSNRGVQQYMAAVYEYEDVKKRPWLGYSAFISADDSGFSVSYIMSTMGWFQRLNRGALITGLSVSMGSVPPIDNSTNPPAVNNATLRWVATMQASASQLPCQFFDFNWQVLFQEQATNEPTRIETVSNPPGGYFKSTLVAINGQSYLPGGGIVFNTVRIIKLIDTPPGDYVFNFLVVDTKNQSTPCQLTLTVV